MEWRSIETAPKDGTRILVNIDGADKLAGLEQWAAIAWWARTEYLDYDKDTMVDAEGWTQWTCDDAYYNDVLTGHRTPTHWMPLPNPPKGATS